MPGYLPLLFAWASAEPAIDFVRADERPSRSAADALRATLVLVTFELERRAAMCPTSFPAHLPARQVRFPTACSVNAVPVSRGG